MRIKIAHLLVASLLNLVVIFAPSSYAMVSPNETITIGQFAKIAGDKLQKNIVISPEIKDDEVHLFGTSNVSVDAVFLAVLQANSLEIEFLKGVVVLRRTNFSDVDFSQKTIGLNSPDKDFHQKISSAFSYLSDKTPYSCSFSQVNDYRVYASCPSSIMPLVDDFVSSNNRRVPRVMIRAHILETSDSSLYQVGAKFGLETGNAGFSYSINESILNSALSSLDLAIGLDKFSSLVSLIETNSAVNTVSKPNLLVDSGSQGSFSVTQNIPVVSLISESSDRENIKTKIDYRDVGVFLEVSPVVLTNGRIRIDIKSSVSGVEQFTTTGNPVFNSRDLSSTFTISDGELISIAGIISHERDNQLGGVPILRDIPLIGGIFSTTRESITKKELSVLLVATVVD